MNIISRIAVLSLVSCAFAATSMASSVLDELDQPHIFSVKVPAVRVDFGSPYPDQVELFGVFVRAGKRTSRPELPENEIIVEFGQLEFTLEPQDTGAYEANFSPQTFYAEAPQAVESRFGVKARIKSPSCDPTYVELGAPLGQLKNCAYMLLSEVEVSMAGKLCINRFGVKALLI